jgi:hypothetical protein
MVYISGSQPVVCLPLGVREQLAVGMPNFKSTKYKPFLALDITKNSTTA